MRVRLRSAQFLGPFPRASGKGWTTFGQDGGQSIDLGDGRVLFLFSDTLIAAHDRTLVQQYGGRIPTRSPIGDQGIFLANCAAIAPRRSYAETLAGIEYLCDGAGLPRVVLAAREREEAAQIRFWPEHGIRVGDQIFVYYLGIETVDPTSSWGFRNAGVGIARLDASDFSVRRCTRKGDWRFWTSPSDDLHVGVCVLPVDDWLYVYCATRAGLATTAHLMRVDVKRIEDLDAYEYLESPAPAPRWTTARGDAFSLGESGPEYTVSFNVHLRRYVMLWVDNFEKVIKVRLAEHPWGPFGATQSLIAVPSPANVPLVYLGFEQSIFEEADGTRIFVSYCQPDFSMNASVRLTLA